MKPPQGTPWVVTLSHMEIDADKIALMLEIVREQTSIDHDILYLLARRAAQGICQSMGEELQMPLVVEVISHEEIASRAESSRPRALFHGARSVNRKSVREEDGEKRAQSEKHCSLEEQGSASTSQLRLSPPSFGTRSQKKDGEPMQSMLGKVGWRWANWSPG